MSPEDREPYNDQEEEHTVREELIILARELGFEETDEMRRLREEVNTEDPDQFHSDFRRYSALGEVTIGDTPHSQVGRLLTSSSFLLERGPDKSYVTAIGDAMVYAENLEEMELVERLEEFVPSDPDVLREAIKEAQEDENDILSAVLGRMLPSSE